jgi:hypothetical protein
MVLTIFLDELCNLCITSIVQMKCHMSACIGAMGRWVVVGNLLL